MINGIFQENFGMLEECIVYRNLIKKTNNISIIIQIILNSYIQIILLMQKNAKSYNKIILSNYKTLNQCIKKQAKSNQ